MDMNKLVIGTHSAFLDRLNATTVEQLTLPSPCEGWDVAALLRHMVGGNQMATELVAGKDASVIGPLFAAAAALDGQSLIDAARSTTEAAREALANLDDPAQMVDFPLGPMPAGRLAGFRSNDLLLHAWDLARAIGASEVLPDAEAEACLQGLEMMVSASGMPPGTFGDGPSGALGSDATVQERLLDLSGRRP